MPDPTARRSPRFGWAVRAERRHPAPVFRLTSNRRYDDELLRPKQTKPASTRRAPRFPPPPPGTTTTERHAIGILPPPVRRAQVRWVRPGYKYEGEYTEVDEAVEILVLNVDSPPNFADEPSEPFLFSRHRSISRVHVY